MAFEPPRHVVEFSIGLRKHLAVEMNELGLDEDQSVHHGVVVCFGRWIRWDTVFCVLPPKDFVAIHDFRAMASDERARAHLDDPRRVSENAEFLGLVEEESLPEDAIYIIQLPGRRWRTLRWIFGVVFYWYRRAVVVPRFASACFLTWRRMMRHEIDVRMVLSTCIDYERDPRTFKPVPLRRTLDPSNEEILVLLYEGQKSYADARRGGLKRLWSRQRAEWLASRPYRMHKQSFLFYNPRRRGAYLPDLLEALLRNCSECAQRNFPMWQRITQRR